MSLDNSDLLGDPDFTEVVTVVSFAFIEGTQDSTETGRKQVRLSVQPFTATLELAKEGERLHGGIIVYAKDLNMGDGITTASDCILWRGFLYEILEGQDFRNHGYIKAICKRVDTTETESKPDAS